MGTDTLSDQTRIAQPDLKGTPEFLRMLRAMQARLKAIEADYLTTDSTSALTNKTLTSFTNTIAADSLHIQVRNVSGSTIAKGRAVYISGFNSGLITVAPADSASAVQLPAIGVMAADLVTAANGTVTSRGAVTGIDTSAFGAGQSIYVGTAGALTGTKPSLPALAQRIGLVTRVHATLGSIEVSEVAETTDPVRMRWDANAISSFQARNSNAGASAYAQFVLTTDGADWGLRVGSTAANAGAWELVSSALGVPVIRAKVTTAGAVSLPGNFAFNGKTPIAATAAPAVATDLPTVITLANYIRQRLIDIGAAT